MQARQLLRSFAGGEITPELHARLDLSKFQTGLALAQNIRTLPHGPATSRTGTRIVIAVRPSATKVRTIPFAFSADQTAVIELTEQKIRFHTQGGTLVEPTKAVTSLANTNPFRLGVTAHGFSVGQWVYAALAGQPHLTDQFYVISVVPNANTIELTYPDGTAVDATVAAAFTSGTVQRVYEIASPYAEADLFDIHYAQSADVLTLTHPSYPSQELRRLAAVNWQLIPVAFGTTTTPPTGVTVTVVTASSTLAPSAASQTNEYVVTAIDGDGINESLIGTAVAVVNNLNVSGAQNKVQWTSNGAPYYNVYRRRTGGGVYGFIGQTNTLLLLDDNLLPDTTKVPPESRFTLNTAPGDYPSAVTYGEQRRWFAATDNLPQTIITSRTGAPSNLNSSFPAQDDDALKLSVAAQQQNRIRHLVWLSDLLALTTGGEFRVYSENGSNINLGSVLVKPQGYAGANNVQPAVTTGTVLYVQAQGSQVRELSFNGEVKSFATISVSVMAPHLFEGRQLTDMAFARAPDPTLYVVRDDGMLLGLTYVPEQQVYGWHRFVTEGFVESVCVVAEGNEDALYLVVRRTLNGVEQRFIERLAPRYAATQADCYYVDCGVTKTFAPAQRYVYGLHHLAGRLVQVLADGADLGDLPVSAAGVLDLGDVYTKVHVGLGFDAIMKTLPLVVEGAAASGQGAVKNVNKVHLKVRNTAIFETGPSLDRMTEPPNRNVAVPYGTPPELMTEEVSVEVNPNWGPDGALFVRQRRPLPLTVLSMVPEIAVGR